MTAATDYLYFIDKEVKGCAVRHDVSTGRWEMYNYGERKWKPGGFEDEYADLDDNCRGVSGAEAFMHIKKNA